MMNIMHPTLKTFHPKKQPNFALGQIVMTPGISELTRNGFYHLAQYISRHQRGDWGDLSITDQKSNDRALLHGGRILSAYQVSKQIKIWIITEADRSVTTVLLPSEY